MTGVIVFSPETGQVFHDDRSDLSCFHKALHFHKSGTVERCSRNTVVRKEAVIGDAVLYTEIFKNELLVLDTVGFGFIALLFVFDIVNGKSAVQSRDPSVVGQPFDFVICCHN